MRLLVRAGAALGALLVLLVVLFVVGIPLPGNLARSPLEALLTKVFRVPTRIEGPLYLRTGLVASAEAGALILMNPSNPDAPPLAKATRPQVRIDIAALFSRAVVLNEIAADRAEATITRATDGTISWKPVFARSGGKAPVRFAGIGQVRVASVSATYRAEGKAKPLVFEIGEFAGTLQEREPATARGTLLYAGRSLKFDATSASLAELLRKPLETIPVAATAEASGARVKVKGGYALAGAIFEAAVDIAAENADPVLAAFSVKARESGALDARGRVRVSAREAAIDELDLRLGKTSISGSLDVEWGGERPRLALDLAGARVDASPFAAGARRVSGKTALEVYVEAIHHIAISIDLDAKATVGEFVGLATAGRDGRMDMRINDRELALRGSGEVLGMRTTATLDYSARAAKRTLAWHLEGGRFSTKALRGEARPGEVTGTLGGLRGDFKASGADSHELMASALVSLEARDLRFSWSRDGGPPQDLRLASARLDIASGRSARAHVQGRVGGRPCSLKVTGSTLISLIEGERWPVKIDTSCLAARIVSKGHLVVKGPDVTADVDFNGRAARIGPLAGALGLAHDARQSAVARGHLSLDEKMVRVKLSRLSVGRTSGTGQLAWPLHEKGTGQIALALKVLDVDELAALAPSGPRKAETDLLARDVLPAKLRLPDLDLELSAERARFKGETLKRVRLSAAPREGKLPASSFAFDWYEAALSGTISADFRGARPLLEMTAAAESADVGAALAQAGRKGLALRAGKITASARSAGVKVGELLRSATADAVVEQARFGNVQRFIPGLTGDAEFSAKLAVTEGQPVRLSAKGAAGKLPFDVTLETEPLTRLAQLEDRISATLRAALGETRVEASGKLTLEGMGDLRLTVSGERLDRLGQLAAVKLPEVGPYRTTGNVSVSDDSIRASNIDAKFGKSHLLGVFSVERGGARPAYAADLRAPILHLEDLGLHLYAGKTEKSKNGRAGKMNVEAEEAKDIAAIKKLLHAFNATASLNIEALFSEGKHYASLRKSLTLRSGDLHVALRDVHVSGGKAEGDLRLDTRGSRPQLRLRARMEGFEFGPLAEALRPKTALEGTLDLSLDLAFDGLKDPFLGNANGHMDVAIFPRGLDVGAADYWGTGLLQILQVSIDPAAESRLNCAVGVWDIKNGVMRSQAFFADTTRVRIIGELEANFVTRKLSGRLSPNAKNPGLFAAAPSLGIGGTMESPKVEVTPDSLITAPLRLFLPIHAFAFDWLNATGVPADGSAGCREAFEKAQSADPKKKPGSP